VQQGKFYRGKKETNLIKNKTNKTKTIIQNLAKMDPLTPEDLVDNIRNNILMD